MIRGRFLALLPLAPLLLAAAAPGSAGPAPGQTAPGQTARASAAPSPSGASGKDELFAEANAAFLGGDAPRATALYEALLAEGVASPELETNLGAVLQRQGLHGQAALHFERALYLSPADDDAHADLTELRKGDIDRLDGDSDETGAEAASRILSPLPGNEAAVALVALWSLAWLALALRLFAPQLGWRAPLGSVAAALFVAAGLAALIAVGSAAGHRLGLHRAVVVTPAVPAREGPDAKSASPFEVHQGTPVRVEDRESGFARIKLANGLTGWVPQDAVELVVPPQWGGLE